VQSALLKLINDLLLSADCGELSALCLLDLSAAFDTVDHQLMLTQLQGQFRFGEAHDWFQSYLQARTYSVTYDSSMADVVHLARSVLQGSVLGPNDALLSWTSGWLLVGSRLILTSLK